MAQTKNDFSKDTATIDSFFHALHYHDLVWVIRYSLKYEPDAPVFYEVPRWRYEMMKAEDREQRARRNSYLERVTQNRFESEQRRNELERSRVAYDRAIMKKYNVGPNWRENRWFVSEVRPTL